MILNLSKLPLSDLNSDTNNPYYVKLAKEKKAELDRLSKATYVHPQKIINELTKIKKIVIQDIEKRLLSINVIILIGKVDLKNNGR